MKLRRVPAGALLDKAGPKPLSPRARKRAGLVSARSRSSAMLPPTRRVVFRVTLDDDERIAGVRAAVRRVREPVGADGVTPVTIDGRLNVAGVLGGLLSAGLRISRFHDLRHAAATFLLARGMTLEDVKNLLGHSSITLTSNT